jgi:ABC-type branched-subunit amino acid transport system ATPase component
MKMSKLLFCKTFKNGNGLQVVKLNEKEEAKVRALHDVESIRIFRSCMEDAQSLTDSPERRLKIALALFDKRCDKVFTWMQRALDEKAR